MLSSIGRWSIRGFRCAAPAAGRFLVTRNRGLPEARFRGDEPASCGVGTHTTPLPSPPGVETFQRGVRMNAIKATVMQGRLELKVPLDWPDGTEVLIEPTMAPLEKIGIDESEWRDDPESLADWEAWIKTIEPFELTPDEAKRIADFAEQMRQYNVEAVRRQMQEGAAG